MRPPLVACLCNAFAQRVRAGFGAALTRVTSGPPPPSKYPASALRASAVAGRGTRPPAVKARLHPPQSFSGDRFLLLPLEQLVDFPYRSGDVVDLQQSPGFSLRDRFLLLPLGQLVDFPYRSGDVVDLQQSPGFSLRDRLRLLLLVDLVDFSDWTSAAQPPTMAANQLQLDLSHKGRHVTQPHTSPGHRLPSPCRQLHR